MENKITDVVTKGLDGGRLHSIEVYQIKIEADGPKFATITALLAKEDDHGQRFDFVVEGTVNISQLIH